MGSQSRAASDRFGLLQLESILRRDLAEYFAEQTAARQKARDEAEAAHEQVRADVRQKLAAIGYVDADTPQPGWITPAMVLGHPAVLETRLRVEELADDAGKEWDDFNVAIGKPEGQHREPPIEPKPKKKRKKRAPKNEREAIGAMMGFDDDGNEREIEDPWTSIITDEGRTDVAFARRFLRDYGDNVNWLPAWKLWLFWDDCRWRIDEGRSVITRFAKAVSDSIWHEVADCPSDEAIKFARDMSQPSKWTSALKAAAAVKAIAVSDLNANRWLRAIESNRGGREPEQFLSAIALQYIVGNLILAHFDNPQSHQFLELAADLCPVDVLHRPLGFH